MTNQPGHLLYNGTSMKFLKKIVCLKVPKLSPAYRRLGTEGLLMEKKPANHPQSQTSSGVGPSALSRSMMKSRKKKVTQWDTLLPLPLAFLILGKPKLVPQDKRNDQYRHQSISLLSQYRKT
jgi:hypothetical protein